MSRPASARRSAPSPAMTQETENSFLEDVLAGLGATPKSLPAKYFYDAAGSALFDEICTLAEYYPTRTETAILEEHAHDIARFIGDEAVLVELGAGSTTKVRHLLDAAPGLAAFVPVDISGDHLLDAAASLARDYPRLDVRPLVADFNAPIDLDAIAPKARRVGFFPGSTIGNLTPRQAEMFLARLTHTLGKGAGLIIGVDLKKDPAVLTAAYNDARGVTAAFNLNLLARINRELSGTFDLEAFRHRAFYNASESRVEMHLESTKNQRVSVGSHAFSFAAGETIHTENSYKYEPEEFTGLAHRAGWRSQAIWQDENRLFSIHALHVDAG